MLFKKKTVLFFILLIFLAINGFGYLSFADNGNFNEWLTNFKYKIKHSENISDETINKYLPEDIKPINEIIKLDRNQPEYKLDFRKYLSLHVNASVISRAKHFAIKYKSLLLKVEKKYKVPAQHVVALWAIESRFGNNIGKYPAVTALMTLAYDARRTKFFEQELTILLKLIDAKKIYSSNGVIKSSWAGAMGNFQFIPSAYMMYAVDYNKNGKIDLFNELGDAFASAANYLASNNWKQKEPCAQKVRLPEDFDLNYINQKTKLTLTEWKALGITKANGSQLQSNNHLKGRIITLDKEPNLTYIVYGNFDTIMHWNRSEYFAMTVCLLASQISIGK